MASIFIIGSSTIANSTQTSHEPTCHPWEGLESALLFSLSGLGILANVALILLVTIKKPTKRYHQSWSQGLLLHQGIIDLCRSLLLIYLGVSVVMCQKLSKCFVVDTAFLLLVSVSTVNMLTMLINDAPIFPEHEQLGSISTAITGAGGRVRSAQSWLDVNEQIDMNEGATTASGDSPYCLVFAIFIIWFSCLTIHLGPTFLSGGWTSADGGWIDVCSMVYKPFRHYVLNCLWVLVNMMCAALMGIHLKKLYHDIVKSNQEAVRLASLVTTMIPLRSEQDERNQTHLQGYIQKLEKEAASRVKMFVLVLMAYLACWIPLYTVILTKPESKGGFPYEVTIHLAFAHSFLNPLLFLIMYRGLIHNETRRSCCCGGGSGGSREGDPCCMSCCWFQPHHRLRGESSSVRPVMQMASAASLTLNRSVTSSPHLPNKRSIILDSYSPSPCPPPPPAVMHQLATASSSADYEDTPFELSIDPNDRRDPGHSVSRCERPASPDPICTLPSSTSCSPLCRPSSSGHHTHVHHHHHHHLIHTPRSPHPSLHSMHSLHSLHASRSSLHRKSQEEEEDSEERNDLQLVQLNVNPDHLIQGSSRHYVHHQDTNNSCIESSIDVLDSMQMEQLIV